MSSQKGMDLAWSSFHFFMNRKALMITLRSRIINLNRGLLILYILRSWYWQGSWHCQAWPLSSFRLKINKRTNIKILNQTNSNFKSKGRFDFYLFFLRAVNDSWPLSSFSLSSDWLLLLLLEELLEESLEESLATPVSFFTSILSAIAANSGSFSLKIFNHLRDSFGRPRT